MATSETIREYTPCIEIVSIVVNEAYHEDPDIVKESLSILASVEKLRKCVLSPVFSYPPLIVLRAIEHGPDLI